LVHQIGLPADIDSFRTLCKEHNLILIEDAACAAGSSYKSKKIGSHSELVCFSFHPRKVITTGDGGMISTNNKAFHDRLKLLRQHGMSVNDLTRHQSEKIILEKYQEPGYNYRMTDIQAAIGIKQLEKLDWLVQERRKIAAHYNQALKEIACIKIPSEPDGYYTNYQSYSVFLKENCPIGRNDLMQKLLEKGISTRAGIMTAHRQNAYTDWNALHLPVSEMLSDQSIILPLYVPMTEEEQDYVIQTFKSLIFPS
jgi:perosamine synthetase